MNGKDDDSPTITPPRETAELVGHAAAEATLLRAWQSGRLPHGWLITGPQGIGKATLAYRFARFVLSGGQGEEGLFGPQPAETLAIDPDDPVFRRVAAGGHADLLTVERSVDADRKRLRDVIVVDDVRAAGAFLKLTPAEGGWRIVIVDAAEEMNESAANALLKSLEEPSENALLLLVSHAPGRLLPTIRSRCCHLPLRRLTDDQVVALLARHHPGMADEDARTLAGLAEGSIGRALNLAEEGGLELYRELVALIAPAPALDAAALHGFADRLARSGADSSYRTAMTLLRWWLGRMIGAGARAMPPEEMPEIVAGETGVRARLLATGPLDRWIEVWDKVGRLMAQADGVNLDRKQVVLSAFFAIGDAARA